MIKNVIVFFTIVCVFFSCNGLGSQKTRNYNLKVQPQKKEYHLNDTVQLSVSDNDFGEAVASVSYKINGEELTSMEGSYLLKNIKLGKQIIEIEVVTESGKEYTFQKELTILADKAPKLYTYRIINQYDHDKTAYTQGLEFVGDTLIESTGQYGKSTLRKWNVFTGQQYKKISLASQYFGEGVTVFDNKILQLTWQENLGIVYDLDLNQQQTFAYGKSKEGWGLCYDGKKIYKSDGTEKIWILNPNTYQEEDFIQISTDKSLFSNANELEWVNGKIYANTYQKDGIMIINPQNGAIEGIVDMRGLKEKVEQIPELDVLNGIAYHHNRKTFFITGKNWNKIFEVVFEEK